MKTELEIYNEMWNEMWNEVFSALNIVCHIMNYEVKNVMGNEIYDKVKNEVWSVTGNKTRDVTYMTWSRIPKSVDISKG
jgi:hypothetical protein